MSLLRFLNPYAWLAAVGFAGVLWGLHVWGTHVARGEGRAEIQAKWDKAELKRAEVTTEAQRTADRKTLRLIDNATEADDAMLKERATAARIATALRSERDRLRDTIAGYASGRGLSAPTAADTCSARAAALGDSLASSLRAEEDATGDLESAWTDTRRLLDDARAVRAAVNSAP